MVQSYSHISVLRSKYVQVLIYFCFKKDQKRTLKIKFIENTFHDIIESGDKQ